VSTALRRALRHPSFALGAVLTLLLAAAAVLSLVWTPHPAYEIQMERKLLPPGATHWLGTDAFGRDIASLLLVGARASILVGVVAVGIGLVVGTALGLWASARRGWVEELIMRLSDFGFAFPAILSAIMLTAVFGPGTVIAIIAIGLYNIPTFARITRASANAVHAREFVLAARACGRGAWAITFPGQACGNAVRFSVRAQTSQGTVLQSPEDAPNAQLTMTFGTSVSSGAIAIAITRPLRP